MGCCLEDLVEAEASVLVVDHVVGGQGVAQLGDHDEEGIGLCHEEDTVPGAAARLRNERCDSSPLECLTVEGIDTD